MSQVQAWEKGPEGPSKKGLLGEHAGGELKWGEDNSIEAAPELSEEEKHLIQERMLAVDKIFAEQGQGKYKIELMFGVRRDGASRHQPIPGLVQFLESGGKSHGGGDAKLYICPGRTFKQLDTRDLRSSDCQEPLFFSRGGHGLIYCQKCKQLWKAEEVVGEIAYNLPMRKWAEVVYTHFRSLGMNADVVVKFTYDDIRAATLMEQTKELRGDKLNPVRANRPKGIYKFSAILKDVNAGADLLKRFHAFLTV